MLTGPGDPMGKVVGLHNNSYRPITNTAWVRTRLCKLKKGYTRLAVASDKVYQLLEPHGPFIVRYNQLIITLVSGVRVTHSYAFCVVFCDPLFELGFVLLNLMFSV
jgi:hypothetical protein